jgi:hypothetical protein
MSRKVSLVFEENSRTLEVHFGTVNVRPFRVQATSETGNPAVGRESKTWNFDEDGTQYRVQIQVTHPPISGNEDA